jgi:hypothetical protein
MARRWPTRRFVFPALGAVITGGLFAGSLLTPSRTDAVPVAPPPYVVVAVNDLGMHCSQEDFSEICILPPYNTLRAQVIIPGEEPEILDGDVTVSYSIPEHSRSADKTNFWTYAPQLFGVNLAPDVGLTGHGLTGTLTPVQQGNNKYFEVTGIPVLPTDDAGRLDPYPVGIVTVSGVQGTASTSAVVPVSSEMSCSLCHGDPGTSVAHDILADHDALHGTHLVDQKPVLCASCHADPALGTTGAPGVPMLSHAMHTSHAPYAASTGLDNACYACHPGIRTQCQRDIHKTNGVDCVDCHGGMAAVGDPARMPWADQPRCSNCHSKPGYQFEQAGTLFKDSIGHGGVRCVTCHGAPHTIGPATTPVDNAQAIAIQGHAGPLNTCTACHIQQPDENFFHKVDD